MQKTSRNMMRPVAASSCAACICLQHCAYGKVEPLATFCMCASCESSRQHHCQHAIISSPQESRLRPRKRLLLSSGLGTPRGEANGRRLYSGSEGALPRAKQEEHACRPNRRAHRLIARLLAHSRLHRPSRQLRHASGRRLAGVGESPRQGLAGGSEQHGRFAAIADVFWEADLEFLDELRDPSRTSLSAATFATAARAAEEYKLSDWVRTRNLDGTAIPTARLIDEYQRRLAEQPPSVRLRSVPWTANSTGRNWAFRWRRSQGAMFGKLRTEDDVTLPEKREKARGCVVRRPNSCLFGAREFPQTRVTGSSVWRKWRQGSRQNVAHFLGAVFAPQAQKPCVSSHLPDLWRPENGTRFETPLGPF